MQAKNVIGSLAIAREHVLPGPVLLIDDIVDSRWTLTVAGPGIAPYGFAKLCCL